MDYGIRKFEEEWSIQMPILAQLAESKSRDWNRVIHSIPSLREKFSNWEFEYTFSAHVYTQIQVRVQIS